VLSPEAAALARNLLQQQDIRGGVWHVLDALPPGSQSWEDLLNAVAHLRRQKEWQRVIQVQTLIAVFSNLSLSLSLSVCLYLCTHVSLSLSLSTHTWALKILFTKSLQEFLVTLFVAPCWDL
jgi:hypothetical protein